ncbi:hypothetical protein [Frigidibacter oleivorans]|uniref:hypothetical protein n=1 Tax=Frigidibacter oleivorans TaxID=2487129 RepID=UPI000F8D7DC3|nr:hypothetical protein [Frigidibacter oleivorans]
MSNPIFGQAYQAKMKAKLAALVAQAEAAEKKKQAVTPSAAEKALPTAPPISTAAELRGFFKQHPTVARVMGVILKVWRRSTSRRPGKKGFWAAYPHQDWARWTKVSVATFKRQVELLELSGLLEKVRGRHGGTRVVTFIRPTALALELIEAKNEDWLHLGAGNAVNFTSKQPASASDLPTKTASLPLGWGGKPADQPQSYEELLAIIHGPAKSLKLTSD